MFRRDVPILESKSLLKGFLSGSLMGIGLFNPYGFAAQLILFIIGFVIFLDTVIPAGEAMYAVTATFAAIFGGFISLLSAIFEGVIFYLVLVLILTILVYLYRLRKFTQKVKNQPK